MEEPWKIKESDERKEDMLKTYIIFCEDSVSEPVYFKYFETKKIKVNLVPNQKSSMHNVLKAVAHCRAQGMIDENEGDDWSLTEDANVWCVFDRDKNSNGADNESGNIEFDEAIAHAKRRGIKVAWSNDSFELWVLLHFEEVQITDENVCHRLSYYDRLTEVFRNIDNPGDKLERARVHETFNYKSSLKSENNFRYVVRPKMIPNTEDAIARAKLLEEQFNNEKLRSHERCPLTLIHHLLEDILTNH
ncbi:RloB family protein [Flagellimonas amoyensis]|uniref:RloB family protein n=1 Tax=Flagellimonas amoyensis TaxID=2169401 RepID=UPI000D3951E5|nr:RloB family protein [Allomuricauda amoyensis]